MSMNRALSQELWWYDPYISLSSKYQIGVAPVGTSSSVFKRQIATPEFGNCDDINYIAGEVDKNETSFVVGDGSENTDGLPYCNPKLSNNRKYEIYIGYASRLSEQVSISVPEVLMCSLSSSFLFYN